MGDVVLLKQGSLPTASVCGTVVVTSGTTPECVRGECRPLWCCPTCVLIFVSRSSTYCLMKGSSMMVRLGGGGEGSRWSEVKHQGEARS